jgi:C-terminal processing protease CtpA/Prc
MRAVLDLSSGARLKVSIGELLAADGTPFHDVGVEPDVAVPSGFQPKAADRALELAKLIARRTRSAARADLLQAAHKIVDAPTR